MRGITGYSQIENDVDVEDDDGEDERIVKTRKEATNLPDGITISSSDIYPCTFKQCSCARVDPLADCSHIFG